MARTLAQISTTVRTLFALGFFRIEFLVGGWIAPEWAAAKAERLFTRPLGSSRRRAALASTHGATEMDFSVDGTVLHAYVWGDPRREPYVLFAHGWSSHGTRVGSWIAPLRDAGYAVVTFDQAGHGRSAGRHTTLPDFACHLMAIGHHFGPAALIVGHSLGGAAAALAMARGLDARRAVLIAPAADPLAAVERFSRFVWLASHLGRRMFARLEDATRIDADELQAHTNVTRIGRPALIVHDIEDREVPWSEGERYARFWPAARLLSVCGLGHHRIADASQVIDATLAFMRNEEVGTRVVSSPDLPFGIA